MEINMKRERCELKRNSFVRHSVIFSWIYTAPNATVHCKPFWACLEKKTRDFWHSLNSLKSWRGAALVGPSATEKYWIRCGATKVETTKRTAEGRVRKGSPDRGQLSKQLSKTRVHGEICELGESYGKNRCQSWSWDIFRIVPLWFGLVALRSLLFVLASQVQPLRGSRDFGSTKPKNRFS